ncbi:M15 family metallopeptidase [Rhizobium leguminosarum]|uniref:hypothetical protein n=1 Tax=Rhizobium leguminosarum TaxID=384 RepID=UPI001C9433EA|nr:hypothetical protein [Rhizobium leguminosarum]MBY5568144.1 M15 family metallopeptidase [Rhizobium leguminosarum]MBY5568150.1 M15 family metallopeptidase [Rhizobium leguminosarum]MBY5575279.1 M15 family metallopeptidase [Rhizobium leguminosarum]MBY5575285.1 M15 family metallopeptidase [Rhizobium leguminosarum]
MSQPDLSRIDPATIFPRAIAAMQNPGFLKSPRYQQQQHRAKREGAHPRILEFADKLVKRLAMLQIPVFPHCIVRTEAEQASAFVLGVSWDSPKDGKWPHRFAAVDIIHSQFAWMDKPVIPHAWDVIGHVGKQVAISMGLKVEWGGDFPPGKYDPAHWELVGWKDMNPETFVFTSGGLDGRV